MSTLYFKGKGKVIHLAFRDQFGEQRDLSLGIKLEKVVKRRGKTIYPQIAWDFKKKIDEDVSRGIWQIPAKRAQSLPLSVTLKMYLDTEAKTLKPGTRTNTSLAVNKLIEFHGDHGLHYYTEERLFKYRNHILEKKGEQNTSFFLRSARPVFSYAVRNNFITKNPFSKTVMLRPRDPIPVAFDSSIIEKIIHAARNGYPVTESLKGVKLDKPRTDICEPLADQIQFLLLTGWRSGESCLLEWDHVNWKDRYIVRINEKGTRYEFTPLYDKLSSFLKTLPRSGKYVFHYRSHFGISIAFRKVRKALGIDVRLHVHKIRSIASSYLLKSGVPLAMVSEILGHRDTRTTQRHYMAYGIVDKINAINKAHESSG